MANELNKGQALVEIVFSISIVAVILSGLIVAVVYSQKATRSARARSEATQLAQQRIEFLRSEEEAGNFWTDPTGYNETDTEVGEFTRNTTVTVDPGTSSPNRRAEVEVTVVWSEGAEDRSVTLNSYITEY